MTKKEIIEEIKNNLIVIKGKNEHIEAMELFTVTNLIDKILNDFESRICGNCLFYKDNICCNGDSYLRAEPVDEDFGCNLFKMRKDERN